MIIRKEFPQKRIVLINDICNSKSLFNFHQSIIGLNANIPPPNVVSIDLILNEEQFKQIKHETELFSFNFAQLLRQKPAANFNELNEYMKNKITKYNRIVTTGYNKQIYSDPVIYDMKLEYAEIQLSDISQYLQTRTRSASFNQYNQYNEVSDVEFREAKKRWGQFTSELKLGTNYPSKFNQQLNKLDQIGAINLDRIRREQIPPNILIENCIALFFNPYEGLPHTLDSGPVNDAHLMAELYISKGYNVVYLCDATPHEYYKWMDWLLSNVKKELVSYFSGHGTQIPDETGQEVDGLSEVLVFYNSNKKTSGEKITALKGITNETVSDTVMHDLIISKDYPNTRIVLITDCCHSGTMFNFDLPLKGKLNSPKTNRINVICVGAALDAQTAKQTVQGKIESGVFTFNFVQFIKTKQTATFIDLEKYMKKNIQKYQTIQITSNNPKNLKDQIISSVRGVIKRGIEQEIEIDENENENENERERKKIKYKELKKEEYKQQKETKKSESQYRRDEKPKMDQSKKEEVNKEKNSKEDKKKSERKKEKDKNINKNEKKNKK
ncbi:MAG: hypothetical protein EZS28_028042 [Streblomastix strix]|uniref:Peptidase C14 caspase domain-containing protein n=1 Tax=Streblomastix strix TaxID=222440 RepID=A0A5J4V231_9EUKA|nr:MAG: hypothetical protein EZS28_028042 [Streblomastix strix]